jgi:hypothetical protein
MSEGLARLRPLALQLGDEESLLDRAIERLHELDPGDIALLPELVAWTDEPSEIAYGTLLGVARDHGLGVITTLNLPSDLTEDLPGRDPDARYNAVVLITRHGHVHIPQAKVTPQSFETSHALGSPGIGVAPYHRINRVRLDLGEVMLETRFFICSDLWAMMRLPRPSLRCDLAVVPANFAAGAELHAYRLLAAARATGVARATAFCNAYHVPSDEKLPALAASVEDLEVGDAELANAWADRVVLEDGFRIYDDARARTFVEMANLPEREGRIAVPRSLAEAPLETGEYPITVVF